VLCKGKDTLFVMAVYFYNRYYRQLSNIAFWLSACSCYCFFIFSSFRSWSSHFFCRRWISML